MLDRKVVEAAIGKGFADYLDEMVMPKSLQITRRVMIEKVGNANFNAAANLDRVLNRLGVHTIPQLYNLDPMSLARCKGIGEAAMFVAMCILDFGRYDPLKWWGWNGTNEVKFSSFKHRAMKRARKRKQEA